MARIPLGTDKKTGNEAWAEVIDPDEMSARTRRKVREALPVDFDEDGKPSMKLSGGTADLMKATMIAEVIEAWWKDAPITADTVEALPAHMFDKLVDATVPHFEIANFSSLNKTESASSSE